jgi:uncharacterized membrane protein (DUF485 family)
VTGVTPTSGAVHSAERTGPSPDEEVIPVAELESERTHRNDAAGPVYDRMHATDDFQELRRRYRAFAIPWTVAFIVWYLLYVIMSNWATGFMNTKLFGNINVALVFGLLQFVSTFGIAWLYSRHAKANFDPIARDLERKFNQEVGR